MNIPVFHDDQHGTAIICTLEFLKCSRAHWKKMKDMKIVFNGAGAAAMSCAEH